MAQNTFRTPPQQPRRSGRGPKRPKPKRTGPSRFQRWLGEVINFDKLFGTFGPTGNNAWPIRHLDRILWVSLLLIVYIFLNHNAERLVRKTQRAKTDVDELHAQYTTLNAEFMKSGKQSEISKRVLADSLLDNQTPPYKIVVHHEQKSK